MNGYRFKATPSFWKSYRHLSDAERAAAKRAYRIFKQNPFDPRLGVHKIHALSARAGRTIYAVKIAADLRAVFFVRGNQIVSFDIGTHAIYR